MARPRKPVELSEEQTVVIPPPAKPESAFRKAISSWTSIELVLLVALIVSIVALSVVTIANGNESAAESGLRGITIALAGALTGLKVKNGG